MKHTGARDEHGNIQDNHSPVYPEPGVRKSTSFSIEKFGEKGAREKAIEFRRQKEIAIYGESMIP